MIYQHIEIISGSGGEIMTRDMTEGRPLKLILGFAVPLLFGNLFQQFYNLVDTIIVGKFLGVKSLAAVGSRLHKFSDYRFLHGHLQRLCNSNSAELWGQKRKDA